jgi:hypothetical protein
VVAKVISRHCENKTSLRVKNEEDEDEAFLSTSEDKSTKMEVVFIAYESGTKPDLANFAYKLSLLNFF